MQLQDPLCRSIRAEVWGSAGNVVASYRRAPQCGRDRRRRDAGAFGLDFSGGGSVLDAAHWVGAKTRDVEGSHMQLQGSICRWFWAGMRQQRGDLMPCRTDLVAGSLGAPVSV